MRTRVEDDDDSVPLAQGHAICTEILEKAFEQAAGEVGASAFVFCQQSFVVYAIGDVTPGVGSGGVVERVREVQRAVYTGGLSGRRGIPFGHRVTAIYWVPVDGFVVGFGSERGFSLGQRRYLKVLTEGLLSEAVGGEGLGS